MSISINQTVTIYYNKVTAGLVKACKAENKDIYQVFVVTSQRIIDEMSLNLV